MAQRKSTKIVSKKHLARLERERRQTRLIVVAALIILGFVFLSIVYGALNETLFLRYKAIVTVNDEKVSISEFQSRATNAREQLIDQYLYYYQMASMFGIDPSTDSSLSEMFTNIQNQLDSPENLANQVLTIIEDDLLIKQYAIANGITVTQEEVQAAIEKTYSYFPDGTQTLTPTITQFAFSTLSADQLELVTATPTPQPTITPTTGPTFTATSQGTTVPSATPAPSATPVSADGFKGLYQDALDHYRTLGFNEQKFRTIFFENALYREKIKALVTADVAYEVERVWARHILVADQATAETVYALLMAGGNFGTLAKAYSTDGTKDIGGDLGWFGSGQMVAEFETAAFALPIGEISQPVQSQFGFHIIQVLGHENRPLTADEYKTAVDDAFTAWLDGQRKASSIELIPEYLSYVPSSPTLQEAFNDIFSTQTAMAPTYQAQQETYDAELALTPSTTPLPPTATP